MEAFSYSCVCSLILSIITLLTFFKLFKQQTPKNLPPGPRKLPLIGNLHQVASKNIIPHRRMAELAKVYGPIMHLRLGEVSTVLISSAEMAREVMKTHDAVLCSRPQMMLPKIVYYNCTDIGLAPYGEYWRQVRKIATVELFTSRRVQSFRCHREEGIMDFIKSVLPLVKNGSLVNLSNRIFALALDITLRLAINKKAEENEEYRELIKEMIEISAGFSIGDLYPSMEFISIISGMKSKLQDLSKRLDKVMDPIIEEHIRNRNKLHGKEEGDLVDVLLNFVHKDGVHPSNAFSLTTNSMKGIIFELFAAGGETSSITIDWAMSELLKNPEVMKKAQNEVRQVFDGKGLLMIDEATLDKLNYLKNVVRETLRLHPPGPLLLPRESMDRCEINGYEIPSKTRILVNVWMIGRDPKYWKDPKVFNPERFEYNLVDYKGTNFEFIPFGTGRRMCPGMGLGLATVELVLAMLLYHFDWKLPHGISPEDLNMDESFGLTAGRKNDNLLVPILHPLSGFKDAC